MSEKADSTFTGANAAATRVDAPSGLDLNPRPPRPMRVSKRAAGVVMAVAAIVLGLFAYGGYKRQQRLIAAVEESHTPQNVAPATAAGADIAKEVPSGNVPTSMSRRGSQSPGELQPPPSTLQPTNSNVSGGRVLVRQAPMPVQPAPQIPPAHEATAEDRRLAAAYEAEQRAMAAPTTIGERFGSSMFSGAGGTGADDATQIASMTQALAKSRDGDTSQLVPDALRALTATGGNADSNYTEQNMQDRKEAFLSTARARQLDDYLKSTRTPPLSEYELKAGWDIPAVLEQALNSELPGELKALVTSNVYDTATGSFLMIPQGSRLIGVYNSRIGYGQDGVQVIWDRLIFPDGSSLDLAGMSGQDAHGFAGFRDKVDRHYARLVGFAVLTSMFAAASDLSQSRNRSLLAYPSPTEVAGDAAGRELSDVGAQITRRNLNVQPTIKIPVGYKFNVRVNRDILFDSPYEPIQAGAK